MIALFRRALLCLVALTLVLVVVAWAENDAAEDAAATESAGEGIPEETVEPEATPKPAKGYVLVTTATQSGWLPLPEDGEISYPLRQILPDGTEAENIIHLTPDGVYMEDSTCANHDCIEQGIVTLENKRERVLSNMIICLPNQVTLQLFTPEEVLQIVKGH